MQEIKKKSEGFLIKIHGASRNLLIIIFLFTEKSYNNNNNEKSSERDKRHIKMASRDINAERERQVITKEMKNIINISLINVHERERVSET